MPVNQAVEPSAFQTFLDSAFVTYSVKIIWAVVAIIILLMISKVIANVVQRKILKWATAEDKHIDKVGKLIHDITFYILVIFSFFIGFEMVGFNVWLILGGISFWVWLAFKEILGNMVAGMMILYTKEFRLGDIIEINADQTYFGRIEEIQIRYTIIRTLDLRQVVIPNTTMISSTVKTFSAEPMIKLNVAFWSSYDADTTKCIEVMKEAVNSCEFVKNKETTKVFLSAFLDSSIEYKSFFDFDPNCGILQEVAIGQASQKIGDAFSKNNIDIPYNITTINFDSPEVKKAIQENVSA